MVSVIETIKTQREPVSFVLGIIVTIVGYAGYTQLVPADVTYYDDEVHVHSDFLFVINDEIVDLSTDKYQSSIEQILHKNFHFHDNSDDVIHRHDDGLTLAVFLDSLGFTLTNSCLTTDSNQAYCTNANDALTLYVNNEPVTDVVSYIPQEEDKILLYYGNANETTIADFQQAITDDSCYYSGTCPERGTPPPESCGLTCEI